MKGMWNREGFTLMEVIVALAILALAFVALLGIRDSSMRAAAEAERLTRATIIARKVIGIIELDGLDKDGGEGTDGGFSWTAVQNPEPIGSLTLKKLSLVLWQGEDEVLEIVEYMP